MEHYARNEVKEEREEWEHYVFYFEKEGELEKFIKDNWWEERLMEKLLMLVDEVFNKNQMHNRLLLVCDVVAKLHIPNSAGKNYFWKFRHMLFKIENYMMEKSGQNFLLLKGLHRYYTLFSYTIQDKQQLMQFEERKFGAGQKALLGSLRGFFAHLIYEFTTAAQLKELQKTIKVFRKVRDHACIGALDLCLGIMVEAIHSSKLTLHEYEKLKGIGKDLPNYGHFFSQIQLEIDLWVEKFLRQFPTPNFPIAGMATIKDRFS